MTNRKIFPSFYRLGQQSDSGAARDSESRDCSNYHIDRPLGALEATRITLQLLEASKKRGPQSHSRKIIFVARWRERSTSQPWFCKRGVSQWPDAQAVREA